MDNKTLLIAAEFHCPNSIIFGALRCKSFFYGFVYVCLCILNIETFQREVYPKWLFRPHLKFFINSPNSLTVTRKKMQYFKTPYKYDLHPKISIILLNTSNIFTRLKFTKNAQIRHWCFLNHCLKRVLFLSKHNNNAKDFDSRLATHLQQQSSQYHTLDVIQDFRGTTHSHRLFHLLL